MEKIAIVGSEDYVYESRVSKLVKKIYDTFGPTAMILTGGKERGPDNWAKKIALELGMQVKEYNPAFTGYRMYSAMPKEYYNKGFHISHFYHRFDMMLTEAERVFIFLHDDGMEKDLEHLYKRAEKRNIPCKILLS